MRHHTTSFRSESGQPFASAGTQYVNGRWAASYGTARAHMRLLYAVVGRDDTCEEGKWACGIEGRDITGFGGHPH